MYRLSNVKRLESVISVAHKTPLEITLGICIRHFCIDPMTIPVLVSHQAVSTLYNKIAPMAGLMKKIAYSPVIYCQTETSVLDNIHNFALPRLRCWF